MYATSMHRMFHPLYWNSADNRPLLMHIATMLHTPHAKNRSNHGISLPASRAWSWRSFVGIILLHGSPQVMWTGPSTHPSTSSTKAILELSSAQNVMVVLAASPSCCL